MLRNSFDLLKLLRSRAGFYDPSLKNGIFCVFLTIFSVFKTENFENHDNEEVFEHFVSRW